MNLAQLFETLVTIAKAEAAQKLLPLIANFFNSIAANPTAINIAAQAAVLNAGAIAALPGLEQALLQQIATTVSQAAQAAVSAPVKPA